MSVPAKRRRWWITGVLVAGALFFAAPAAWRYRPLNRTERQLVGDWRGVADFENPGDRWLLRADRRFTMSLGALGTDEGSWSADERTIVFVPDRQSPSSLMQLPGYIRSLVTGPRWRYAMPIRFDGDDHLVVAGNPLNPKLETSLTRASDDSSSQSRPAPH